MLYTWEGNRRFIITLTMASYKWFIHLQAQGLSEGDNWI